MSTDKSNKFSCIVIGSGSLPIRCAEILLRNGHEIRYIASSDDLVKKWVKENQISLLVPGANLAEQITGPYDYLFSINNEHILRENVLQLPGKLAINYHDAPLPKYAGTHATSWALMSGESSHGISWHIITDVVDAGDVLKQRSVEISGDDTALTLNTKCYEAAINAFEELTEDLAAGNTVAVKQNLEERTFFPRFKRPANGCVISWGDRASEISALVRALNFGNHPNPLGRAKLAVNGEFFVVQELEILTAPSDFAPGTINKIGPDFIRINTADRQIILRNVSQLDGQFVSIADLAAEFHLYEGYRFTDLDPGSAQNIDDFNNAICKQEAFWVRRLSSLEPALLPYANSNSSTGLTGYENVDIQIPDEVLNFLGRQDAKWKIDDFLITAFGAFLSRLGGTDSFDVGYQVSETQSNIGNLFADYVPLRFNVESLQSCTQLHETVKEELDSIKMHKTYANDLVTRYPQFHNTVDSVHNFVLPIAISKVERLEDFKSQGARLTFLISENEGSCRWIYDREKLNKESVDKLIRHFTILIKGIAASPESQIALLPLVPEDELHQLFVEWNDTLADYPKELCIHQLFDAQADRTPDAVAVISGQNRLNYRDLNHRANQLANHLINSGVGPEALVGICVERSLEMIVCILGVLKAGGTYIPLDPAYPSERLKFILDDSQLSLVLTQRRFFDQVHNPATQVMCIDTDWNLVSEHSAENPVKRITNDKPAYIIYTSGSTGTPKGVRVAHSSLVNHSTAIAKLYGLHSDDRVLQFASVNFDVAAEEIFPTLLSGAAVVLPPEQARGSLKAFSEFLRDEKLTVVNLPASYWHEWVLALVDSTAFISETIRLVVTGSERVLQKDFESWQKIAGDKVRWLNAYGLTETTITSLVFDPARSKQGSDSGSVPIGRPISNTEVYLLDHNHQPVPVGIPGHLYIGGDCLALGYLNRPELTNEKFIPHPFNSKPGARLCKTGDMARYLPGGEIEYLDRFDNQVKIRGYRIELGEIETVLTKHPGLRDAAVIAKENESGDIRLAAFFVGQDESKNKNAHGTEIWPSIGEYPVYDDLMYYAMSTDKVRTSAYETAIRKLVKDKTVVEIGTGKDVILARFCVDAGAKKVYAIEASDTAYTGAQSLIKDLGLSDKITLIKGFSFDVQIPEKVDVCVSEIIGTIGGSEGVEAILNDARRFLKDDGLMIPERCVTRIAAVQLPDEVLESPRFSELSGKYAEKIFRQVGHKFDVRVCLRNLDRKNLLSDDGVFEDLNFTEAADPASSNKLVLTISRSGRLDGFLLWLNLQTAENVIIDNSKSETSWLPVYFPVFEPGINVYPGDVIKAVVTSSLSDNGFNPDYNVKGLLIRKNGERLEFEHNSAHHKPDFEKAPFYRRLFSQKATTPEAAEYNISAAGLRAYLSDRLPDYMIPSAFIELDELPLANNGKVDRKALPLPVKSEPEREFVAHRDEIESQLVEIWERLLEVGRIGIHDNFFELGGHSLQAIRMFAEVERIFSKSIPIATLFQAGTIEKLAAILRREEWSAPESSLVQIQPNGSKPTFFCIHAAGGNVLFYRDLSKYLGDDQPFFGLQARRLGGRQAAHETVEEMADFYIKEIRNYQPEGPYYLGGSSFGGIGALEIAQQLYRQGHKVALLALLDTGTPDYPKLLPGTTVLKAKIYGYVRRIQHHRDSLAAFNSKEKTEYIFDKLKKVKLKYRRKILNSYKNIARNLYQKVKGTDSIPANYIQIDDQIANAVDKYLVKAYPGKMTLFRATSQPLGIVPDPKLGWNEIPEELEIHEVPGHHGSIVTEPYVRILAEKLRECIDRAESAEKQFTLESEKIVSVENNFAEAKGV